MGHILSFGCRVGYGIALMMTLMSWPVLAADAQQKAVSNAGVGVGDVVRVILMLALIIGIVVAAGWITKRFRGMYGVTGDNVRIVGGVMVGQREKVVLLEARGQYVLVGVASGSVSRLHVYETASQTPANMDGKAV